jgi:hypothetical protein
MSQTCLCDHVLGTVMHFSGIVSVRKFPYVPPSWHNRRLRNKQFSPHLPRNIWSYCFNSSVIHCSNSCKLATCHDSSYLLPLQKVMEHEIWWSWKPSGQASPSDQVPMKPIIKWTAKRSCNEVGGSVLLKIFKLCLLLTPKRPRRNNHEASYLVI